MQLTEQKRSRLAEKIQARGAVCFLTEAKQGHVASAACFLPVHVSTPASFAGLWRIGKPLARPRPPQLSVACPSRQLRCLMRHLCSLHMHHTLASGDSSQVRRVPCVLFCSPLLLYTNPAPRGR